MKDKLLRLIDVKSIVTIALIFTLVYVVLGNVQINNDVFLLFSNATTMIITYFFTKRTSDTDVK
jgi:hypothetical protein